MSFLVQVVRSCASQHKPLQSQQSFEDLTSSCSLAHRPLELAAVPMTAADDLEFTWSGFWLRDPLFALVEILGAA